MGEVMCFTDVFLQYLLCHYEQHEASCPSGSRDKGGARRMPVNWDK